MPDTYRCTNVLFAFDGDMTHITLNCDLELFQDPAWVKVDALVGQFTIKGRQEFRDDVIAFIRGECQRDHERRTTLAYAKQQLEAATFTVD